MTLAIHHALRASERATRATRATRGTGGTRATRATQFIGRFNLPLALRVGLTGRQEKC